MVLDCTLFMAYLIAMAPRFSGLPVHEWLGVAFAAAIVTHLLLHWDWIINTTKRIFNAALHQKQRVNYLLNLLLFIDVVLISLSGIMISRAALPALGLQVQAAFAWRGLHTLSANVALILLGTHIALHWQWIGNTFNRYVFAPIELRFKPMQPARPTTEANS